MRVLIVGAGGYLGAAVARRLAAAGHDVQALARDSEKAAMFAARKLTPVAGDPGDESFADAAMAADAVVFCAAIPFDREWPVLQPVLDRMAGSGKAFILTSGTAVLSHETPHGEWREETYAEDDAFTPPAWIATRVETENKVREAGDRGVRAMVVRPPQIWGNGGSKQIPAIIGSVRSTGAACYIGEGLNLYTHVHVDDLAEVYRLALEKGTPSALYHAVAGEANWGSIARAVARAAGVEARSVTLDEAKDIWGQVAGPLYFGVSSRSRAPRTRRELGWAPTRVDILDDIENGSYRPQ